MHAQAGSSVAKHLMDAPCPHPVLSGTGNAAEPHPPQNSTATATSQETTGPESTRPGAAPARASFALNLTSQITSRTRTKTLPNEEFPKKRSFDSAHTCTSTCFPEPQYYRRFPDFESGTPWISQKPTCFPRGKRPFAVNLRRFSSANPPKPIVHSLNLLISLPGTVRLSQKLARVSGVLQKGISPFVKCHSGKSRRRSRQNRLNCVLSV